MTERPIGDYLADVDRFGGPAAQALEPAGAPDDQVRVKGQMVLRLLANAALTPPFGFDPGDAAGLWGSALAAFSADTLMAAVGEWVGHPGAEWPTVSDLAAVARGVEIADRAERARNKSACRTCEGTHRVKVVDSVEMVETHASKKKRRADPDAEPDYIEVELWHAAPCPDCPEMAARRLLYDTGHFAPEHQDKGGCLACWPYMASQAHRVRHLKERAS